MVTVNKNTVSIATFVVFLFAASPGYTATHYEFDAIFDGDEITSVGSIDPLGMSLVLDDSFSYTLQAAGADYWTVTTANQFRVFFALGVSEFATRVGNMSLSFYLDGVLQLPPLEEQEISNGFGHLGTNAVSLAAGVTFDEIVLDYLLISSLPPRADSDDTVATVITDYSNGPFIPGGFDAGVSYVEVSEVPIPAAAWLFASALMGLSGVRRSKA